MQVKCMFLAEKLLFLHYALFENWQERTFAVVKVYQQIINTAGRCLTNLSG